MAWFCQTVSGLILFWIFFIPGNWRRLWKNLKISSFISYLTWFYEVLLIAILKSLKVLIFGNFWASLKIYKSSYALKTYEF